MHPSNRVPPVLEAPTPRLVRIVSFNIGLRGLALTIAETTTTGQLADLLSALGSPDIACFQETKTLRAALREQTALATGYACFFSCHRSVSNWSGVLTCVRANVPVLAVQAGLFGALSQGVIDLRDSSAAAAAGGALALDSEGRVLLTDHGAFVLANVYMPAMGSTTDPSGRAAAKEAFCEGLAAAVAMLQARGRCVIVVGDLNVAHRPADHVDAPSYARRHGGASFESDRFRTWLSGMLVPRERITCCSSTTTSEEWGALAGATAAATEGGGELEALRGVRPLLVDSFRALHPEATSSGYSCWSTAASCRLTNHGVRIDYVLVDAAFCSADVPATVAAPTAPAPPATPECTPALPVAAHAPTILLLPLHTAEGTGDGVTGMADGAIPVAAAAVDASCAPLSAARIRAGTVHPGRDDVAVAASDLGAPLHADETFPHEPSPLGCLRSATVHQDFGGSDHCPVAAELFILDWGLAGVAPGGGLRPHPASSACFPEFQRRQSSLAGYLSSAAPLLQPLSREPPQPARAGGSDAATAAPPSGAGEGMPRKRRLLEPETAEGESARATSSNPGRGSTPTPGSAAAAAPAAAGSAARPRDVAGGVRLAQSQLSFAVHRPALRAVAPIAVTAPNRAPTPAPAVPMLEAAAVIDLCSPPRRSSWSDVASSDAGGERRGVPVGEDAAGGLPAGGAPLFLPLDDDSPLPPADAPPQPPAASASASSSSWAGVLRQLPTPMCRCAVNPVPAIHRTVRKAGPTQGRSFWVCPKPAGARGQPGAACDLFLWADTWARMQQQAQQTQQAAAAAQGGGLRGGGGKAADG